MLPILLYFALVGRTSRPPIGVGAMRDDLSPRMKRLATALASLHYIPAIAIASFLLWHAFTRVAELWGAR
jgi:hypothetical protein